jgi:DNA helicase-2/ATP-dependent DNA helicase PcrA
MRDRPGALMLTAAQKSSDGGSDTAPGPEPELRSYPTDSAEARAVAGRIAEQIAGGTRPQDIAVLYRINVQGAALETALNDAGVSYQLRGGKRFFELPEVKQALMMLKGAVVASVGEPLFKTVSDVLRSLGWTQDAPESRGAVRDRWESLNALMGLAEAAPRGITLREFVEDLYQRAAAQHEPTMEAVTLATLHSAKGLEWDTVHLVGLSEGLVPITYAKTFEAIDEERRLLYVGLTRARKRLHLSWAQLGQGRSGERAPSRFLEELRNRTPGAAPTPGG